MTVKSRQEASVGTGQEGTAIPLAGESAKAGRFGFARRPMLPWIDTGQGNILSWLIPWIRKGGFALLDQGLISGSNFVISILLARWLVPDQYGSYAVAFGVLVLVVLVYQSLVLEPMAVFGASSYRASLRNYLHSVLRIHLLLWVPILLLLGIAVVFTRTSGQSAGLSGALGGVMVAAPCVLLFWLARGTFYVKLSPASAAAGAAVYSSLALAGLYVVYRKGWLSPFTAFLLMALAALATGAVLLVRLRRSLVSGGEVFATYDIWRRHWGYGRWALASCIAGWLPAYVYYPLLSSFSGMSQSGQLKALMNLTLPLEQAKAAMSLLLLPFAAGMYERQGETGASSMAGKITFLTVAAGIVYWSILIPLQKPLFHLLYSNRYLEVAHLLPLVALGSIFYSAAFGGAIVLRAMDSPGALFGAFGLATALSLLVGIPATKMFGLTGAIWGSNIADIASLIMVLLVLRYKLAGKAKPAASFVS